MNATNQAPGASPVLVVDVERLAARLREQIADPSNRDRSYTDDFTGLKTDLAAQPAGAVAASRQVLQSDVHAILGWSIAETTGNTPASVRLFDGMSTNAEQFVRINLAANESVRDWFIPRGIRCFTGNVFLQVITGSVEGVIYWL